MLFSRPATDEFFRSRIDHMIDLRHPLALLSSRMPWQEIEARVVQVFSRNGCGGVAMPDPDLFGEPVQRTAARSNAGRSRIPLHIMIALLYRKHAFNESEEGTVERWGETPTWQFFSGQAYFEYHRPCDATTLIKFRQLLGEEGAEELLAQTINVAVELQLIKPQELTRVIVDSTVQHKSIVHSTDSRLLETARAKLVEATKDAVMDLKQTFAKEGKELGRKARRYAHASQFKRMRRAIKRQRTIVGLLQREIDRTTSAIGAAVREVLGDPKATRIAARAAQRKAVNGQRKLYSFYAPEVECISKGKAKQPYEFGVKVGIASTLHGNLIAGARAFHGNPYDGHNPNEQLEQVTILMQDSAAKPAMAFVDLGYRCEDAKNPDVHVVLRGKSKRIREQERSSRGARRSSPSSPTSRATTAWTFVISRVKPATDCMRCCVRRATASVGCCA